MTAPIPTPAEQAVIDRFGIFAEEETVELVARAIDRALDSDDPDDWMPRGLARAVVAAIAEGEREIASGAPMVTLDDLR